MNKFKTFVMILTLIAVSAVFAETQKVVMFIGETRLNIELTSNVDSNMDDFELGKQIGILCSQLHVMDFSYLKFNGFEWDNSNHTCKADLDKLNENREILSREIASIPEKVEAVRRAKNLKVSKR